MGFLIFAAVAGMVEIGILLLFAVAFVLLARRLVPAMSVKWAAVLSAGILMCGAALLNDLSILAGSEELGGPAAQVDTLLAVGGVLTLLVGRPLGYRVSRAALRRCEP